MNSIVCLETIAAFVLGFCFICESTLTRGPNDTSVVSGETVTLECFTTDKNYPPAWSYLKVGSGEKKDISLVIPDGDRIMPKLVKGYDVRYSIVGDRNKGEYSLQITDAKSEDAGTYTCTARGGLSSAEKRSAELSIFEPFPVCASNNTDVVGENDCRKEPDVIELSCKFQIYGNYLPKITWTDVSHPEKVIKPDSTTTNATGMVSYKLIIKGNRVGLDKTFFRCIVGSTENADDSRFTCDTPKINVLKISNLTESKALEAPEEVECTRCKGWSQLNASSCEWLRRVVDDNGHQRVTFVTSRSLLNLHNQDMKPGTYICVADCKIRGETCKVELLDVSYKLGSISQGPEPVQSTNVVVVSVLSVLGVVALVVVTIVLAFFIWKWCKNKQMLKRGSPASSDSSRQNQQVAPLLHELRNGVSVPVTAVPDVKFEGPTNKPLEENDSGKGDSNPPSRQNSPPISQETLLPESDSSNDSSRTPSQQSNPPSSQEPPKDFSVDIPDAKLGGPTRADKNRLAVERAEARMRANAALRSGEKKQTSSADTDVAEGVEAADKEKHE